MCGIAGFCLHPEEEVNAKRLSMGLLTQIVKRGQDATGAAWVEYDNKTKRSSITVSKAPVSAHRFEPFIAPMPIRARRAILHTRWATQGSPQDNLNNHPIVSGGIIGVHNGVLHNDDAVFAHIGSERFGQVDSEAAFALIDYTSQHPANVLSSLKGRAALAWFDARDKRDLHLARVSDSPLVVGGTAKGSLIFASTLPLLLAGVQRSGLTLTWTEEIEERTYLRVRNGEIADCYLIGESEKAIA